MSTSSVQSRPSLSQIPSTIASTSIVSARPADGQKLKVKCASRQSLIDTVTGKFSHGGGVSGVTGFSSYMGNGKGRDLKTKTGSVAGELVHLIILIIGIFE